MPRIAVFAGSFDPFTVGHESIVRRALPLFDQIIIAIGYNSSKTSFFPLEKRRMCLEKLFSDESKIEIDQYEGLTVDYCKKRGIHYILRGLRTSADFEYERAIGQVNKVMFSELETVFLLTLPEHSHISSTIVREIIRHGGDASVFLPQTMKL